MTLIKLKEYLGEPYILSVIDNAEVVYRRLNNNYEIEIFKTSFYNLCVWSSPPRRLVCAYKNIESLIELKDLSGYVAVRYQNLLDQILVEHEE